MHLFFNSIHLFNVDLSAVHWWSLYMCELVERSLSSCSTRIFRWSSLIFIFVPRKGTNNDDVRMDERQDGSYTMETVLTAVFAACLAALLTGFLAGYACARRCTKSEDDNLPYPDTEYEYFEQRHNMNAWVHLWNKSHRYIIVAHDRVMIHLYTNFPWCI